MFAFANIASATTSLTTSSAGYTGPTLDLSGYANGNYNFYVCPVSLPADTFTAAPGGGGNSGKGSVIGQGGYGLGDNGSFGGTATYIGVDSGTGYATLTFLNSFPALALSGITLLLQANHPRGRTDNFGLRCKR